ncbi:MAG: alpha/beta fold hydrolase [Acidobacteriota bacterium]|nr:alpha/beta fold hydrolase [Acidobacteriota bacterium]
MAEQGEAADEGSILAHAASGEGPPLLLLNGGMMTYLAWEPLAAPLRESFQVVGCDFRGQLRSPGEAPADLAVHAADVVRLLDHLGLPSVHVLGTSFGGAVGVMLAALHPQRVRSFTAVTIADHATEAMDAETRSMAGIVQSILEGGDRQPFLQRLEERVFSPAYRERKAEELAARRQALGKMPEAWFRGLVGILAAIEGFDLRPHLPNIACPTRVVLTEADRVMPPEHCRALAEAIPQATVTTHPTAGHALVAEEPQWLREVVEEFLGAC